MKYYELIGNYSGEVIGVTTSEGLLHAIQEDQLELVGEISKKDFDRFGDDDWTYSISKNKFKCEIIQKIKLTKI